MRVLYSLFLVLILVLCCPARLVLAQPAQALTPEESVRLFELAMSGDRERTRALYEWFLPLLRMDTVPKFVQLIKLVQRAVGLGSERVRPPRLPLEGEELKEVQRLIDERLGHPARVAA